MGAFINSDREEFPYPYKDGETYTVKINGEWVDARLKLDAWKGEQWIVGDKVFTWKDVEEYKKLKDEKAGK